MKTEQTVRKHLESLGACAEAMQWIGDRTSAQAWNECERADWLLWWAAKTPVNSYAQIVLAAAGCAGLALIYVPKGEDRPQLAIEAALRWANNPTERNQRSAKTASRAAAAVESSESAVWRAAQAAAYAAAAAACADAASASAAPGHAAIAAADAALAADAVRATSHRAPLSLWWTARAEAHREMCALVRGQLAQPWTEGAK